MIRRIRNKLLIGLLLSCGGLEAQNFTVKAQLEKANANGFYAIKVTPQLSSHAKIDYSDLRITDDDGKVVPYIIVANKPSYTNNNYRNLPIVKNEFTDSGRSALIIQNNSKEKISSLALVIRNASVNRQVSISGSDDMIDWFTISENISLEKQEVVETDRYIQTVNFLPSSYNYFKLIIDNGRNNPLNITEARSYITTENKMPDHYTVNPLPVFKQVDSADKNSYIKVHQREPYHIDRIKLLISTPGFFERDVYTVTAAGNMNYKIRSGNNNVLDVPAFNDKDWMIKIYNGDNPPLKTDKIITEEESKNIIAYFEAGKNYYLLLHDSAAVKPVYDLQQFKDSIPRNPPSLNIISFDAIDITHANNKTIFSKAWLWVLIAAVLALLGFITYRLTKEMDKSKTT